VAVVEEEGRLRGARFVGTASAAGDRVAIRFRTLVLPGGEEARISAEAQDEDGSTGIGAAVSGGAGDEPSLGREVATDTATDVATDLASDIVGGGVLARAGGSYLRGSERRRRPAGSSRLTLAVPEGTTIRVVLLASASISPQ